MIRLKYNSGYYKTPIGIYRLDTDINQSNISFWFCLRLMEIKTEINKWDLIKLESFFTANEAMNKMKRQPTDWKKIFSNYATNKGFISKICKQLIQLILGGGGKGRRPK